MSKFHIDKVDMSVDSSHAKLIKLVGNSKKVFEVGCSNGYVSKVLKEQFHCSVTGLEIDPNAAKEAQKYCFRIIVGDVEEIDFSKELGDEKFDVITFGDVLEHLENPQKALEGIRGFLRDNGYVLASIPNIAHISVGLELLEGKFNYRSTGLLDDTHIRFFTKENIQKLFRESGFEIVYWDRVIVKPEETEFKTVLNKYPVSLLSFFESGSESQTYQFIVKAIPSKNKSVELLQQEAEMTFLEELRNKVADQELIIRRLKEDETLKRALLESMINSWSWKLTAPLRWLHTKVMVRRSPK